MCNKGILIGLLSVFAVVGTAFAQFPRSLEDQMACLERRGLIRGTMDEVARGDAHFAPYFRSGKVVEKVPTLWWNGPFIEGRGKLPSSIVKECIPDFRPQRNM